MELLVIVILSVIFTLALIAGLWILWKGTEPDVRDGYLVFYFRDHGEQEEERVELTRYE